MKFSRAERARRTSAWCAFHSHSLLPFLLHLNKYILCRQINGLEIFFYNHAFVRAESVKPVRGDATGETLLSRIQTKTKLAIMTSQLASYFEAPEEHRETA